MTDKKIGLTLEEVLSKQKEFGKNELLSEKKQSFFNKIIHIIFEPMFLLLIVAATIYFILGSPRDGAIMLIFVIGIISIDIIQEWKTDKTLNALKNLSAPHIKVIRDGKETLIESKELVPDDIMLISEGDKIPADGIVLKSSDLCVDESSLTGESVGVWKTVRREETATSDYWKKDYCYAGTFVTQGSGVILVDKTGAQTEYGKIGKNVAEAKETPSPLKIQTGKLVKICAGVAAVLFALVGALTFINLPDHMIGSRLIESILSGITLAMAMIPEEFPVILTVFLSMGAWRLAKKNSLVRKLPAVETLGAVSVLCVDKTGTITKNQMTVTKTYALGDETALIKTMGMGCETDAYDPMEKAMLSYVEKCGITKDELFSGELLREYAFTNEIKMMGHVWQNNGEIKIACKGSPEKILSLCGERENFSKIENKIEEFSKLGLRVIAVAHQIVASEAEIPENILDTKLTLDGLIGLQDPPRDNIEKDIKKCIKAGVRVVMITGDNGLTASSIAKQIGMPNAENIITGDMLEKMSDEELCKKVKTVSIFSRVIPEHKMRIVKAFKNNGEIVAMTGDGVNDAPALKYADIGIAMGKRGSEVSREAADLILMDDNFSTIVDTIKDGRRIYDNIKKAVGYVFAIHVPIALASLLAPLLGIAPSAILFLPLHVVILELLIDPTCSIVLERQPAETDIMERKPRKISEGLITKGSLFKNITQGIIMFLASFGAYYITLKNSSPEIARTVGLAILMISNLFLVQVNSSNTEFVYKSVKKLAKDKVMWIINIATLLLLAVIIYTPLNNVLSLSPLSFVQVIICFGVSMIAVFWYEFVKLFRKLRHKKAK